MDKFNIRFLIILIFATNIFFQEKLKSHNKVNGGCESHCQKDNFILNNSNLKKNKNLKFKYNKNINSCINRNLCRG